MKKFFVLILILVCLAAFFIFFNFWTINATKEKFIIPSGERLRATSTRLEKQGIIKSALVFEAYVRARGFAGNLKSAEYDIVPKISLQDLVQEFTLIQPSTDRTITIIEGWTLRDIGLYLENTGIVEAKEFAVLAGAQGIDYRKHKQVTWPKDFSALYDFFRDKPVYLGLEGYLFPDTYRIKKNATLEDIIRKMLDNFGRKITPELRAEIRRQGKTVFDIVRMASVIEREVQTKDDKALVADLFWRRLKLGIPLQADSTVNYITLKSAPSASRNDIDVDSPWNTYKYRGLPLGPIGNPGMDSITAAVHPKQNQYLYFLTDKDGTVHYAKTLDEQIRNKQRYLR